MIVYRISELGSVICRLDSAWEYIPTLGAQAIKAFEEHVVKPWEGLAAKVGGRVGVSTAFILGTIFQESLGNHLAQNAENPPGLGLMQVTNPSLYSGHARSELLTDPELNITIGAKFQASLFNRGLNAPQVASCYNAGAQVTPFGPHPSSMNAWGMRCSAG